MSYSAIGICAYKHPTMPAQMKRTLVLMRDFSAQDETLFVADLYSGNTVEDTVYLPRTAMLAWVEPLAPTAGPATARALDELMRRPPHSIIDVPLHSARPTL
jgi:hypothetical protein